MKRYKHLKFEFKDGVALITLNRPDISNALNIPLIYLCCTYLDHVGSTRQKIQINKYGMKYD